MTRPPLALALALALLVAGACAVSVVGLMRPEPSWHAVDPRPVDPVRAQRTARVEAAAVLRSWDDARAGAWASGDVTRLRALYAPGSAAGRADRAMLRAWTEQELTVEGMRTQLLAVDEVSRSADRWTLRVTDRLAAATAVGSGVRLVLPRDLPTSRVVVLRLVGGEWRVASVRAAGSGGS